MIDYAATNHATKQDLSIFEMRMQATYATRDELKEVERQVNETSNLTTRIESRLEGIEKSVDNIGANVARLFWSVIGSVFLAVIARVMGWL